MHQESIQIKLEPQLSPAEFIDLLHRSTLAERRPVDCLTTIRGMLKHANIIASARTTDALLVGIARSITDFHYCTYLSDLAVDQAFQGQGIGRRLIEFSHEQAGRNTTLILLSAPKAVSYYPHIGMQQHPSCWIIPREAKRNTQ